MGTSQGAPGMFVQSRRALGGWRGAPEQCKSKTREVSAGEASLQGIRIVFMTRKLVLGNNEK